MLDTIFIGIDLDQAGGFFVCSYCCNRMVITSLEKQELIGLLAICLICSSCTSNTLFTLPLGFFFFFW